MWWVPKFSTPSLEQEYQAEMLAEKVRLTRIMALLGATLNLCFVILDFWAIPSALVPVWCLRAAILAVLAAAFASTWSASFRDWYAAVVLLTFAVMGSAINGMILLATPLDMAIDQYFGGLLLIIIGLHTLTYVHAVWSFTMSLALLGTYALVVILAHGYDAGAERVVLVANLFVGVSVAVIGIVAQSLRERYARENYLLRHTLQHDVEIKEEEKRRASYLAEHDPLTGLANRLRFARDANALLDCAAANGGCVAVMFLDLDGFKPVNDSFGHSVGDRVLRVVAERLRARLRAEDVCARVGGDEFVVAMALPGDDPRTVHATARRLADAVAAGFGVRDAETIALSASIGVAMYPVDGRDLEAVLRAADERMYHVKRHGKSGIAMTTACDDCAAVALPRPASSAALTGPSPRSK